ncbi:MAG: hypothetical protein KIT83_04520 [Bryobacterales bacterium]|nr:hypothetical protein [Bryobacterales bacterium]
MHSRRSFLMAASALLIGARSFAAVRGDEVMYVGGTLTHITDRTEGRVDLSSTTEAVFNSRKGSFALAYARISSLEYGQQAGRRVGVAIAINPLFLFSKKRKHFLTVGYTDAEGQTQGAVLEIGKKRVRAVLDLLETRSGKQVEYESEEAKKHVGNE